MIAKLSLVLHDWLSSFNWLFSYSDKYQVRVEVQRKPDYPYTWVKHISLIRSEKTSRFVGINVFNIGIRANSRIRRDEWVKIFDPLNTTSQKVINNLSGDWKWIEKPNFTEKSERLPTTSYNLKQEFIEMSVKKLQLTTIAIKQERSQTSIKLSYLAFVTF